MIPEDYSPTVDDVLTLGKKAICVHWVKDGQVGYALDYGSGFEDLERRPVEDFVKQCREEGVSLKLTIRRF